MPVKTKFGWHIIKVEDRRESSMPTFDKLKSRIVQHLARVKTRQITTDMRKSAKVEYLGAPAEPK